MDYRKKNFAINALRRASYRWPSRYNALKKHRIGRNEYFCASCGVISGKKDMQLDHIHPVVPVTGWDGFDGYIDRMFTDTEDGFNLLCKNCHKEKTDNENKLRLKFKK